MLRNLNQKTTNSVLNMILKGTHLLQTRIISVAIQKKLLYNHKR